MQRGFQAAFDTRLAGTLDGEHAAVEPLGDGRIALAISRGSQDLGTPHATSRGPAFLDEAQQVMALLLGQIAMVDLGHGSLPSRRTVPQQETSRQKYGGRPLSTTTKVMPHGPR